MYNNDMSLPPPVYNDKPTDDDFVCPPLPPPPSEEDLLAVTSHVQYPRDNSVSSDETDHKPVITPTFKATSSKFSVWSPKQDFSSKVNGTEVDGAGIKPWQSSSKESGATGFRSVARPTSKKPEKSPGTVTSSTTTTFTLPEGQKLPGPSENVEVTPKHELPEGAVYETKTLEDGVLHTDTYYPAPGGEKMVLERTKKTTVIKAEHHQGMGPTNEEGIPVALRSTVENPKQWYKNMFKQIHKVENEEDDASPQTHYIEEKEPVTHSVTAHKPKRVGRIMDYTPSTPYVVENRPQEENKIPPASTSYHPLKKPDVNSAYATATKPSASEPIHGTEYSANPDYTMADYVVTTPKQPTKPKQQQVHKTEEMRKPAKVKFDFVAQSDRQLTLLKDQIVIITREVNKDWYEGESGNGKHSGIFPVAYVEVLEQSKPAPSKKGSAKAKFDFNGTSPKQLSVKKGDSIELIEKVDKNWYKGSIGSRVGILPANYIEVIRDPEEKKSDSKSQNHTTAKQSTANHKPANVSHKPSASLSSTSSDPDDKDKMSRASYLAHAVVNSGANLHHSKPRRGEFDIPELDDAAMGITHPDKTDGVQHTPQHSYETTTSNTSSSLHSDLSQSLYITPPEESPRPQKETTVQRVPLTEQKQASPSENVLQDQCDDVLPPMYKHVALYPYVPQNEDELELIGGDIVQVIEKCDDGWFVGTCERTGAFGTFPGNYVIAVD